MLGRTMVGGTGVQCHGLTLIWPLIFFANATFETYFSYHKDTWNAVTDYYISNCAISIDSYTLFNK